MEQWALGPYAAALHQGSDLPDDQKHAIAAKLEGYTGVPAAYWYKANLRVSGGEFSKELQSEMGITTGRLDTRYEGPDLDPLSEEAGYDPPRWRHRGWPDDRTLALLRADAVPLPPPR